MRNQFILVTIITSILATGIMLGSCRKKGDTIARITVRDSVNMLVPNARVVLSAPSTTDPQQSVVFGDTAMTNTSGVATFNFNDIYQLGQAGVGVFDIVALKNGLKGEGIIKVDQEVENNATVFLR